MTSLYENQLLVLCDWTTYHTDLARLALFEYRPYLMALFNTATRYAGLWRRGMSITSRAIRPGFDTRRKLYGIGYFLLLHSFVFFALFLPQWLIFLFFFHIDILI